MLYNRKRVMRVPIKDDGSLYQMLLDHKESTNGALRFYRNRIRAISTITDTDRRTKTRQQVSRLIEAKIKRDAPSVSKMAINLTAQNSVIAPLKEFMKRRGNRKKPPRYRKMDLRLRENIVRVDLDAGPPTIEIGFQNQSGRGVVFHSYQLYGSQRYFDRFKGMDQTVAFLNYKNGRVWANLVFSEEVQCTKPQAFIGLDAGMYSNKSAWVWALKDAAPCPVTGRISADETPQAAAQALIELAKEHQAALVIENLKTLNRSRSGKRYGLPTSKFSNALVTACEDNAIALIQVDPAYTSLLHYKCHFPLERPKDERGWDYAYCHNCDEELSADENAAINISRKVSINDEERP